MKNHSSESLRRVLRHLKPYTGWIILALLCAAGNVAAALERLRIDKPAETVPSNPRE